MRSSTDVKEKNQGLIEKIYGENDPIQDSNNLDLQSDLNIDAIQKKMKIALNMRKQLKKKRLCLFMIKKLK